MQSQLDTKDINIQQYQELLNIHKKNKLKLSIFSLMLVIFITISILLFYGSILIYLYCSKLLRYNSSINGLEIALYFIGSFMILIGIAFLIFNLWIFIKFLLKYKINLNSIKVFNK